MTTKAEIAAKFEKLGVAPPANADRDELERTYSEVVQNMIREGHDLKGVAKADQDAAQARIDEAAAGPQAVVDMATGETPQ